jgi:glyoxalase superfamily protein
MLKTAKEFYCRSLGFDCVSSWRPDETKDDPCYMVFVRDGVRLHVTSFRDGVLGVTVYVFVDDVDALYAEFAAQGVPMPAGDSEAKEMVANATIDKTVRLGPDRADVCVAEFALDLGRGRCRYLNAGANARTIGRTLSSHLAPPAQR